MASMHQIGKRMLRYTFLTVFSYTFAFLIVLLFFLLDLLILNPLSTFYIFSIILNLVLYVLKYQNVDSIEKKGLELLCAVTPALLTPLGGYLVGGFLMTLEGLDVSSGYYKE